MDEVRSEQPHDRLTRICAEMVEAMEAHPEYGPDIRCIVFLNDESRGGIQMFGYERDSEAIADLFIHMRAMFRANGKDLGIAAFPGQG